MAADVTFYLGRAGSGKSAVIFDALRLHQQNGERAFLIVPEQFTFEVEQRLFASLGGLIGVEVLSFARLSERILALSGRETPYLNDEGLAMIVRRSALKVRDRLSVFGRVAEQAGFAGNMARLITKFTGAGIGADMLTKTAEALPGETLLASKLTDIALLYTETEAYLKSRYLTADDAMNAAAAALPRSFVAGAPVYIDGFEGATKAVYTLLSGLFRHAGRVFVALTLDPGTPRDAEAFKLDRETLDRMTELAQNAGSTLRFRNFSETPAGRSNEMAHLETNLFARPGRAYLEQTDRVSVLAAPSRQGEADEIADRVLHFVKNHNCRYRDAAVLASDLDAYAEPLLAAMRARGIPAFLDRREKLKNHALTRFLLSSVRAAANGLRPSDALAVLKSGFLPVEPGDADAFENHILRYGLKGSQLEKPFTRGEIPPGAESARAVLCGAILPFRTALAARKVSDKVRAVYEYFTRMDVKTRLVESAGARMEEGRLGLMQVSAQAYNRIMELLSELDAILGTEPVSRENFCAILEEGFADAGVGIVPELDDGVLIGEALRTRTRPVEALFVLGANEGKLPKDHADDGVLDDRELKILSESGAEGLRGTDYDAARETRGLYLMFSRAKTALTVSCALTADGQELLPGKLFLTVTALFPNRALVRPELPRSVAAARKRLSAGLKARAEGEAPDPLIPSLVTVLSEEGLTSLVSKMEYYSEGAPISPLKPDAADALYGNLVRMSASRLEHYSQCPFQHYASYGLGAKERPLFKEQASDFGSLCHAVLDAFIKTALSEGADFRAMTDADCDRILNAVLPGILAEHNNGFYVLNDRARGTLPLLFDTLKRAVRAIRDHLSAGAFAPEGSELRFGPGCDFPEIELTLPSGRRVALSGVIDRLDKAKTPEGELLRVIDYKTAGRKFSFAGVYHGLTLQLPLYLDAVAAFGGTAAGLYYMPISVPAPEEGPMAAEELKKAFLLRGLTLSEEKIIERMDASPLTDGVLQGVKRDKSGAFKGGLVDRGEMKALLAAAKKIASKSAERLIGGCIEAFPIKKTCEWCAYRAACRFDETLPRCRYRRVDSIRSEDFFSLIGGCDAVDK